MSYPSQPVPVTSITHPSLSGLQARIVKLERDEAALGQVVATMMVNFGPEGRRLNGIVIQRQSSAVSMLVEIVEAYQSLLANKKGGE